MNKVYRCVSFLMLLGVFVVSLCGVSRVSSADILITPTLLTFEGRDRFTHITLANTKNEPRTYEMKWVFNKMNEGTGLYSEVAESVTDFDLSKHVVFAPKRVTLAAGGTQRIKLGLRRPAEVPAGDYHAHLRFTTVPDNNGPVKVLPEGKASASVTITVSYTVPVVFRAGDVDDGAEIGQINLVRDTKTGALNVDVPVTRKAGPHGVLGHLFVYHVADGREELVGEISNANMFPEISQRTFSVRLKKEVSAGTFRVVLGYYDKNKSKLYAQREFPLN